MEINAEFMKEIQITYPDAKPYTEGGLLYVHLPKFTLPAGNTVEALLLLNGGAPYTTRLFLPAEVPSKGPNWTQHVILSKTWWTWSWKDIPSDIRYMEMLSNHLRPLR
jgi:hypothetical protein